MLNWPEMFRTNAFRYKEHSCKFWLQKLSMKKVTVLYAQLIKLYHFKKSATHLVDLFDAKLNNSQNSSWYRIGCDVNGVTSLSNSIIWEDHEMHKINHTPSCLDLHMCFQGPRTYFEQEDPSDNYATVSPTSYPHLEDALHPLNIWVDD